MWNFDKIQLWELWQSIGQRCGLMWNFDKIQPSAKLVAWNQSCGLMWNFDKIQQLKNDRKMRGVVV